MSWGGANESAAANRVSRNVHEIVDEASARPTKTPGPGKIQNPDQKLVIQMLNRLSSLDCDTHEIAVGIEYGNPQAQIAMADVVFQLISHWARMGQYVTDPDNPLRGLYAMSKAIADSVSVHPNE